MVSFERLEPLLYNKLITSCFIHKAEKLSLELYMPHTQILRAQ